MKKIKWIDKKIGENFNHMYLYSYFKIYCVWSTLSHNKPLVFFSRSCVVYLCPFCRHRDQEYISRDIKIYENQKANSKLWKKENVLARLSTCHLMSPLYVFNIFGIKCDRNIIITVISDHLSHDQDSWPVYFLFANLMCRSNGHVTAATAHHRVNRAAPLLLEIYLSYHAIMPVLSIGLKNKSNFWFE